MKITVNNPYHDPTYETQDLDLNTWKNFLENKRKGKEELISFVDEKTGNFVTLNLSNLASIEVSE